MEKGIEVIEMRGTQAFYSSVLTNYIHSCLIFTWTLENFSMKTWMYGSISVLELGLGESPRVPQCFEMGSSVASNL